MRHLQYYDGMDPEAEQEFLEQERALDRIYAEDQEREERERRERVVYHASDGSTTLCAPCYEGLDPEDRFLLWYRDVGGDCEDCAEARAFEDELRGLPR